LAFLNRSKNEPSLEKTFTGLAGACCLAVLDATPDETLAWKTGYGDVGEFMGRKRGRQKESEQPGKARVGDRDSSQSQSTDGA